MRKIALRRIEATLLVIGLVLIAIFLAFRIHSIIGRRAAIRRFAAITSPPPETRVAPSLPGLREVDSSLWSEKRIADYKQSLTAKFDDPIAVLIIQKISLEVPVFDGTDELILNRGTGRISGTARPGEAGNMGIAGHRDGFFRGLKDLQLGDEIELASLKGKSTYAVDSIEIVSPEDVSVLQPRGKPALTLVTCYPFYFVGHAPKRFIVHASIAESNPQGNRRSNYEVKTTDQKEDTK
jgi:sortase A